MADLGKASLWLRKMFVFCWGQQIVREAREQIQSINKEQESERNVIPDVITVWYITMILFFKLNNTVIKDLCCLNQLPINNLFF